MRNIIKYIVRFVLGIVCFLIIALFSLSLLFSPKKASPEELQSYQLMLEEGMMSYGFTGKVKLTNFRSVAIGNPWDIVEYDYTEVIDGQSVTLQSSDTLVDDQIKGQEGLVGKLSMTAYFNDAPSSMLHRFDGIVDQAMWHQPRGTYLLSQARQAFASLEESNFTLFGVEGRLENQDEKLSQFYQKVAENRLNGGAFAGFYDMDLDWLMREGLAVIEVEFFNKKVLGLDNELEEEDSIIAELKKKVESFNYSRVEDGVYCIGFRTPTTQSVAYFVTIRVKDHRYSLVR